MFLYIGIFLALIFILIITLAIIYRRYYDFREYAIIEITPTKFSNYQTLIDKMIFFISTLKSMPESYGDFNVILDISNRNNINVFRIIVPVDYAEDVAFKIKDNFGDFKITITGKIDEETYLEEYS